MMFVMFGGRGEAHWIVSKSSKVPVDGSSEGTCPSGTHRATKTGLPYEIGGSFMPRVPVIQIWDFPKIRAPYFGVLIIRILLFRVLYWGPYFRKPPYRLHIP